MVNILGTGLNLEAPLAAIGETISDYANNIISTLINWAGRAVNWIMALLQKYWDIIRAWFMKFIALVEEHVKRYFALLAEDPFKWAVFTINTAIVIRNLTSQFSGGVY